MNSDIRLSIGWNRHPKIVKLRRRLGADGVLAIVSLWTFAGEHRPDGDLSGLDSEDIAIAADYPGDAGALIATLLDLCLLDKAETGNLSVHGWAENNSPAPYRSARQDFDAAKARWERETVRRMSDAGRRGTGVES